MRYDADPVSELHYLSATEALHRFGARQLSPVELLQALIDRAERVEPQVNAFAEEAFDGALIQARRAEERYAAGAPEAPRALEGLPVAAKEEQPIAGRAVTDGTLLRAPRASDVTAIGLERIMTAGAVVHARTTTSEFCCMPLSHTLRWGVTRNPWNLAASAGGSSGGSAASLAAGTAALATGSDIGGSLRAPASFNGIVAFKPPHARIPVLPPAGMDPYFHHGPMARSVADCALLHNVMVGPDSRDHRSLRPALPIPTSLDDVRGLRVAYCPTPGDLPVEPEVQDNTRATAEALRAEGALVEEVEIAWRLDDIKRAFWAHFGDGFAAELLALAEADPGAITGYTLAFARKGVEAASLVRADEGLRLEAAVQGRLDELLERFDALIMPTIGALAFAAGEDYVDTPLLVDGVAVEHFSDASLTPAFNICSACPVLAVPSGWASNGVPTGVQVAARTYDDVTAFRVGAAIERTRAAGFAGGRTPALDAAGNGTAHPAPR